MRLLKEFDCACGDKVTKYQSDGRYPSLHCEKCNYTLHVSGPTDFWFTFSWKDGEWTKHGIYYDGDDDLRKKLDKLPYPRMLVHWSLTGGIQPIIFQYDKKFEIREPSIEMLNQKFPIYDIYNICSTFVQEFAAGITNPDDWEEGKYNA